MNSDVFIIVMDSVRYDRILGESGINTPNIEELIDESFTFSEAYSTGSWTVPSHGSLFSGLLPSDHGSFAGQEQFKLSPSDTLASKFAKYGYQTAGFSSNPWIISEFGYDKGFDYFEELQNTVPYPIAGQPKNIHEGKLRLKFWQDIFKWLLEGPILKKFINLLHLKIHDISPIYPAEEMNNNIKNWLIDCDEEDSVFTFINYMDAHEPYQIRPNYIDLSIENIHYAKNIDVNWNDKSLINPPPEEQHDIIHSIYDSSVKYLDDQIGVLTNLLRQEDRYQDSWIVLLADHGQLLGEDGYWGHNTLLTHELVHIPLIIKPPNDADTGTISTPVSIRDIPGFLLNEQEDGMDPNNRIVNALQEGNEHPVPVFVESFGPPSDNHDFPAGSVSSSGYRVMYYGPWRLHRDLDTDNITIEKSPAASYSSKLNNSELLRIEDEYYNPNDVNDNSTIEDSTEISKSTKEQLESLGYR